MTYPHKLGAVIMMKNEQDTILITLGSVLDAVDCVVVYDTGSTDNTVGMVEKFCFQHKLPLYLTRGVFVDFSTSRNVLVEYAEQYCEYQLHLDSADKLLGGRRLKAFCQQFSGTASAFMIFQQWFMGATSIRFRNMRLMKSGHGYRYKCRVHEMLCRPNMDPERDFVGVDTKFDERPEAANNPDGTPPLTGFVVFQNRMLDNTKTLHRFQRDAVMLYDDWLSDPDETRTLFYLGQTYDHMGDPQKGYLWYQKRVERELQGFIEESLHAHMRLGKMGKRLGMADEVVEGHYWDSIAFSMKHYGRTLLEPVLLLVQMLDERREFARAFTLLRSIMEEPYPVAMNLFVDATAYKYSRYHWMGRVAWYVSQYVLGGWNAIIAHRVAQNEVDLRNVKVYLASGPQAERWLNNTDVDRLVRSCPSLDKFDVAWSTGVMDWPDVAVPPPQVNTSSIAEVPGASSSTTTISSSSSPSSEKPISELTNKQKLQAKRQKQRLMRKAK